MPKQLDRSVLEMALIGYAEQRRIIEEKIADIQKQLGGRTSHIAASGDGAKPRRKMSAKGKAAIRAAQKKRWAEFHAKAEKPARKVAVKKAAPKRKLSPARKAALVANLAKARAAKAAKKAAAA
jgi:hypothetical protein